MREFTFGQYYPEDSVMHRLDARVKIVMTIAFMVGIFLVKNFVGFILPIIFLAAEIILSKVPFNVEADSIPHCIHRNFELAVLFDG